MSSHPYRPTEYDRWLAVQMRETIAVLWNSGPGWCRTHRGVRRQELGCAQGPGAWACPCCFDAAVAEQARLKHVWELAHPRVCPVEPGPRAVTRLESRLDAWAGRRASVRGISW